MDRMVRGRRYGGGLQEPGCPEDKEVVGGMVVLAAALGIEEACQHRGIVLARCALPSRIRVPRGNVPT